MSGTGTSIATAVSTPRESEIEGEGEGEEEGGTSIATALYYTRRSPRSQSATGWETYTNVGAPPDEARRLSNVSALSVEDPTHPDYWENQKKLLISMEVRHPGLPLFFSLAFSLSRFLSSLSLPPPLGTACVGIARAHLQRYLLLDVDGDVDGGHLSSKPNRSEPGSDLGAIPMTVKTPDKLLALSGLEGTIAA